MLDTHVVLDCDWEMTSENGGHGSSYPNVNTPNNQLNLLAFLDQGDYQLRIHTVFHLSRFMYVYIPTTRRLMPGLTKGGPVNTGINSYIPLELVISMVSKACDRECDCLLTISP